VNDNNSTFLHGVGRDETSVKVAIGRGIQANSRRIRQCNAQSGALALGAHEEADKQIRHSVRKILKIGEGTMGRADRMAT